MDENEIQIVLTAVDNASTVIDKVNDSLGGVGGSSGFSNIAENASDAADDLTNSFEGMTRSQLLNLNVVKMSDEVYAKYRIAVDKTKVAQDAAAKSSGILGLSMTTVIGLAGGLAAAVAVVGTAYLSLQAANQFATDALEEGSDATDKQIRKAEEYTRVMSDVEMQLKGISNLIGKQWEKDVDAFGEGVADIINYMYRMDQGYNDWLKSLGIDLDFTDDNGVLSFISDEDIAEMKDKTSTATNWLQEKWDEQRLALSNHNREMMQDWTSVYGLSENIYKTQKSLSEAQRELDALIAQGGPKAGQTMQEYNESLDSAKGRVEDLQQAIVDQTNAFIANILLQKFSADDILSPEERAAYTGFLKSAGLDSDEAINAAFVAYDTAMGLVNGVAEATAGEVDTTKTKVEELLTKLGLIPEEKHIKIYIDYIENGGGGGEGGGDNPIPFASGGTVRPGQRALVGDKPGGIPTPWSEIIEALPGGGVRVYPNSQTSAMRNMPSFAEGGTFGSDLTGDLSRTLRDLPNAIALAIESTLQRSFR